MQEFALINTSPILLVQINICQLLYIFLLSLLRKHKQFHRGKQRNQQYRL